MRKEENVIGMDFQGWPVYKLTLRDLLEDLGAKVVTTKDGKEFIGFSLDMKALDVCPRCFEDDGMGYGVNQMWLTTADAFEHEGKTYINIFRELERNGNKETNKDAGVSI